MARPEIEIFNSYQTGTIYFQVYAFTLVKISFNTGSPYVVLK